MKYLGEMEQNISLSLNDVLRMPAHCKDFSNAKIYCITTKHQQDPQNLNHLKNCVGKGTLITS